MKHVYFLKYNNYANRIFKRGLSLSDYLGADDINKIAEIKKCTMWNPNDGITTTLPTPQNVNFSVEPDYCLVTDEYGNIDSRWFVTETVRLLSGQYQCYLKRDVFVEAWEELLEAKCNIDRAILLNSDPLIFNPEPITVNEIIKDEHLLKDMTGVPWIVFYSADLLDPETNFDPEKRYYDISTSNINTWKTTREINFLPNDAGSIQVTLKWRKNIMDVMTRYSPLVPEGLDETIAAYNDPGAAYKNVNNIYLTDPSGVNTVTVLNYIKTQYTLGGSQEANEIRALDGKIIYDSSDLKYYKISVAYVDHPTQSALCVEGSDTFTWAVNTIHSCTNQTTLSVNANNLFVTYEYKSISITLTEMTSTTAVDFAVPSASVKPWDAPYYMWCMPYGEIDMLVSIGGVDKTVKSNGRLNLAIANYIANKNSQNKTFDVQILPYCPLPDEYLLGGAVHVMDHEITDHQTITSHTSPSTVLGYIFACPAATFTRRIVWNTYGKWKSNKLSDICQKTRIYAPNYSASFEFSPARNGAQNQINVRCTYMPIQPYIRIAPVWGGLYGNETFENDPRGLICGGNYSIARLNDQWVNYQEQNKNLEAIFNREIQHMDIQRKYERISQVASAVAGTVSGAATGVAGGAMAGGAVGAAVGGIAGGIGAGITGAIDVSIADKLYQESKSYATDLHAMQLGNVQALPRSLAKTTAFHVDNRYFPIIVNYLPTDEEVKMVDEYINTHSMTVNAVGRPVDYIYNRYMKDGTVYTDRGFISGSIIKINSTHDTHFVDELNKEFQKGVYLR